VRRDLKVAADRAFKPELDLEHWDYLHKPPGAAEPLMQATNVLPDLAVALKYNPSLRVQLNAGYFDLATPYFGQVYELQHLQIPAALQKNIEYRFYESGHMVYAHEASLKALHDNVADFIARTDNLAR
jgi:carboxypeptidase C (cathepsin A)